MAAWTGGPCPNCGDDVPPKVLRCPACRTLLDPELSHHEFRPPSFAELPELDAADHVRPKAELTRCPTCDEALRVALKYAGVAVACKKCGGTLTPGEPAARVSWLADCPHCAEEIRVAVKYAGQKVSCKFCGGELRVVEREAEG